MKNEHPKDHAKATPTSQSIAQDKSSRRRKAHFHGYDCVEGDIMDMGDEGDGQGYEAYQFYACRVTGETHRTLAAFNIEEPESYDYDA